ncbi:MAG: AmmeMemoRadiSam system radical SAM enzyme, partial [Treponema sp.]|nr:AmmeMemoRadiSam system radical SAM enzyme [Treponema sp.]
MEPQARFFGGNAEAGIRCTLCPHCCGIPDGGFGVCGVRGNGNGKGVIPFYGLVTALALDPIEKKPLFHFRPGSSILSIGFAGCNLRCPFCQNWNIARVPDACAGGVSVPGRRMTPVEVVSTARHNDSKAIAYTYSEPLVHAEFLLDCMSLAHGHGIANVLVTNGCIGTEAAGEILSLADAANIDLKCFSPTTYAQVLGGTIVEKDGMEAGLLKAVLAFIRLAHAKNVHVEVTTLVVPGMNDSAVELDACADFIMSLNDPGIPWHLSAYHPGYLWKAPATDPSFLLGAKERAEKKLRFVYAGNIPGEENNTLCPCC